MKTLEGFCWSLYHGGDDQNNKEWMIWLIDIQCISTSISPNHFQNTSQLLCFLVVLKFNPTSCFFFSLYGCNHPDHKIDDLQYIYSLNPKFLPKIIHSEIHIEFVSFQLIEVFQRTFWVNFSIKEMEELKCSCWNFDSCISRLVLTWVQSR